MEFKQIQGNTWVLVGMEHLPVYRINERDCLLFDTGYPVEREKLQATLERYQLTLQGIFCSHAHIDHTGNASFLQGIYGCPVYLSRGEEGLMCNLMNMKAYRIAITPQESQEIMGDTVCTQAVIVSPGKMTLDCGVEIEILSTPGHSCDHLCFVTPDGVCFLGDALLSDSQLEAKLPYCFHLKEALDTYEVMLKYPYPTYVMAHNGCCTLAEFPALIQANRSLFLQRAKEIRDCANQGKTIDQLTLDLCQQYELNPRKASRLLMYQRNIRFFLEFLQDQGQLSLEVGEAGILYRKEAQPWVLEDG